MSINIQAKVSSNGSLRLSSDNSDLSGMHFIGLLLAKLSAAGVNISYAGDSEVANFNWDANAGRLSYTINGSGNSQDNVSTTNSGTVDFVDALVSGVSGQANPDNRDYTEILTAIKDVVDHIDSEVTAGEDSAYRNASIRDSIEAARSTADLILRRQTARSRLDLLPKVVKNKAVVENTNRVLTSLDGALDEVVGHNAELLPNTTVRHIVADSIADDVAHDDANQPAEETQG